MAFEEVTIGPCRLIRGDCLEVLPTLSGIDAVVTDPPYGTRGSDAASRHDAANGWSQFGVLEWDKPRPSPEHFAALLSLNVPTVIWGGNYFSDMLPPRSKFLIWDKGQTDFSLADVEQAWCSWDGAARRITYARAKALQDGKIHPTQKPLAVMVWCLDFVEEAETILDPFAGSMTTGVACIRTDRKAILIEKERKYFDDGCRRIDLAWQDRKSWIPFDEPPPPVQRDLFTESNLDTQRVTE